MGTVNYDGFPWNGRSMMRWIRNIVSLGAVMVAVGTAVLVLDARGLLLQPAVRVVRPIAQLVSVESPSAPCGRPVTYRVGTIDPGFGVSWAQFLAATQRAVDLWNGAADRTLFRYADDGEVTVNLVFDDRQADTLKLKELLDSIHSGEGKYDAAKQKYDALITTLKQRRSSYETASGSYQKKHQELEKLVRQYEQLSSRYDQEVTYWNGQGGAPSDEYSALEKTRKDLEKRREEIQEKQSSLSDGYSALEKDRKEIDDLVEQANTLVGIVNSLAASVNARAEEYNADGRTREEFEAGVYRREDGAQEIDIYQFFDKDDLNLVLAHEFGHALGLGHVEDPQAVMHYRLGHQTLRLTDEERRMVEGLCFQEN